MATVTIPFDGKPLRFEVPDANLAQVLKPNRSAPLRDLDAAIETSLADPIGQPPIEELVKPTDRVLIVSDDNTRFTPTDRMIPPLLRRLNRAGIADGRIACIMALGTHRYMTAEEMQAKAGLEVWRRIRVFNHEWREPENLIDLGRSSYGTPLQVNLDKLGEVGPDMRLENLLHGMRLHAQFRRQDTGKLCHFDRMCQLVLTI